MAQLHLISQSRIDSIRNPRTLTHMPMHFQQSTTLEMGQMKEDAEPWSAELQWINRGTEPLVVTKVVTTCGCLKVDFDQWPVMADSTAVVRVTYLPKGHPGVVYQRAFIYTTASADTPSAILVVNGEVLPVMNPKESYPQTCGPLRLRTRELTFSSGGHRQQIAVACYNGGNEALRISTDTLLTSPALRISSSPKAILPGEEGELVVTFDPSKAVFINPTMPLYLRGVYLPASQRQLTIRIK